MEQNVKNALIVEDQVIQSFQISGIKVFEWMSNSKILLNNVLHEDRTYNFYSDETVKTLGFICNLVFDCFQLTVSPTIATSSIITKRSVLSDISKL